MSLCDQSILDALPHGPSFRFLSELSDLKPGKFGVGHWRVGGDEMFLAGHFPGRPMVPGVLLGEALAQLSGLVGFLPSGEHAPGMVVPSGHLVHIELRFKAPIIPPATIRLHSRLVEIVDQFHRFEVEALCLERVAARGKLILAKAEGGGDAGK